MKIQQVHKEVQKILADYVHKPDKLPEYLVLSFDPDYTVSHIGCTSDVRNAERTPWFTALTGKYDEARTAKFIAELDKVLERVKGQTTLTNREIGTAVRGIIKNDYDETSKRKQFIRVWVNRDGRIWNLACVSGSVKTPGHRTVDVLLDGHFDGSRVYFLLEILSPMMFGMLLHYEHLGHEISTVLMVSGETDSRRIVTRLGRTYPGSLIEPLASRRSGYWMVLIMNPKKTQ